MAWTLADNNMRAAYSLVVLIVFVIGPTWRF
jgi:hypothetical protein